MNTLKRNLKRLTALLLCAVMMLGVLPLQLDLSPKASAAWSTQYVEKMRQLGIMAGDGTSMAENRAITRAEMMAMLNRAYGFNRSGSIPFTDVPRGAWYYNDIVTAYNEGIMSGTSATKASPNGKVTREQALVLIGNAMRLEMNRGEVTEFTDGRNFSAWSAPYVRSALLAGIISGRPDGSFGPKSHITRGEVACILSSALGTLINTPGDHSLGGVFGNVTINTAHVTLRDTVIAGDLYLTGGVGLGDVLLDNVRVLGRIVIAGGGEAQIGQDSILLNNVVAQKLQIDPATGQYVSIRALGSTDIPETVVYGSAYIQDDVRDNTKGLRVVSLEGPNGTSFTVAGNLKTVINRTPGSTLTVGDTGNGSAKNVTIDEKATDSNLVLDINAAVDEVNLDTATHVSGSGDIGKLNVTTDGSQCEILPDEVVVRPGVTTTIQDMTDVDSEIAKEISSNPRLLEGYPKVRNVAPTTADGYFSVNKAGAIHWALTNAAIGPLTDEDAENLINPSDYGSGLMSYGNITAEKSKTEYETSLTGMEAGGTYYLSAVLVDAHKRRSPVKSQKILTPDGTVPAMTSGYPTITDRTPTRNDDNADLPFGEIADLQATVMANKTCDLYYVLLPAGSTAPQTSEFLSASFVDPYGYGRIHLIKNTMDSFKVNEIDLDLNDIAESLGEVEEDTSYDLYLWLTDADGTSSSQIIKQTVKTKDITPPKFNLGDMVQTATQATSVRLTNSMNESGTVYWVAVPNGEPYPIPNDGSSPSDPAFLRSDYAKLQVVNGLNGFKFGKVTVKANTDFNITISGLTKESAYDVYYLGEDAAKNYSDPILKFTAHTLDSTPPSATQEFESVPEDSPETPYADSTINLVFNEDIRYKQPSGSGEPYKDPNLLNLYTNYADAKKQSATSSETLAAEKLFVDALGDMIVMYDPGTRQPVPERTRTSDPTAEWTVDYRNVRVYKDGAKLVVSFVNLGDSQDSALNLESGASYYFQLKNIADESESHNAMKTTQLPEFTVMSAEVLISKKDTQVDKTIQAQDLDGNPVEGKGDDNQPTQDIPIDISFTAKPSSTGATADGVYWDMLFWFDTSVEFMLFTRKNGDTNAPWTLVGKKDADGKAPTLSINVPQGATDLRGASTVVSLGDRDFHNINEPYQTGGLHCGLNDQEDADEEHISDEKYDYALHFVRIGTKEDRSTFNETINGQVTFLTGTRSALDMLANSLAISPGIFDSIVEGKRAGIEDITFPKNLDDEERKLAWTFTDSRPPQFINKSPQFTPTDTGVTMSFTTQPAGMVYYIISPVYEDGTAALAPRDGEFTVNDNKIKHIATSGAGCLVDTKGDLAPDNVTGPVPGQYEYNGKTLNTNPDEQDRDNYYFSFPSSRTVFNPSEAGLPPDELISGSSSAGAAPTLVNITGLSPETKYYVYLVTQGGSNILSEVKVYQFTTKETSRPIITLNRDGSLVTVNSTEKADIKWLVIPDTGSSMNSLLTAPFTDAIGTAGIEKLKEKFAGDQERIDRYLRNTDDPNDSTKKKFRVIDALCENVEGNTTSTSAGSLFDLFALPTYKSEVAAYIRNAASGGSDTSSAGSGSVTINQANGSQLVNTNQNNTLSPATNYYFLAVGNTPATIAGGQASDDGFRAIYPVIMTDNQHPMVTFCAPNGLSIVGDKIQGTLQLRFDENLYWFAGSGDPKQVVITKEGTAKPGPTDKTIDIYPGLIEYISSTGVDVVRPAADGNTITAVNSMVFSFTDVPVSTGTTRIDISFDRNLCDWNNNRLGSADKNEKTPLSITISVKEVPIDPSNPTGDKEKVIEVSVPKNWDARTDS
jgi:hypothetical protein